ncbi:hypothetical protein TNCV_1540741 [Trichonephila clavipes]|nr:hypothetical protein TNCV_1540741 [Trichonephila clavipes]
MPVVGRSLEHHTGDYDLAGILPNFQEEHPGVPSCHEGIINLQTSTSSLGFEPRPYGTAVSVANHSTGWATHR